MRRSWLKGVIDVTKRYLIAAAAHNLGRILRKLFGIGKPKTLQGSYGDEVLRALRTFSPGRSRLAPRRLKRYDRLPPQRRRSSPVNKPALNQRAASAGVDPRLGLHICGSVVSVYRRC